ncbi:MAG: Rap1a/Tai family immunity protein [Chromatiales bacterium]
MALLASAGAVVAGEVEIPEETPPAQQEEVLSGRELLDACTAVPSPAGEQSQFCLTFIAGLVLTVSRLQESGQEEGLFCIDPEVVSLESVRDQTVHWLQEHERRLEEDAYLLVSEALHQAYPCSQPAGST